MEDKRRRIGSILIISFFIFWWFWALISPSMVVDQSLVWILDVLLIISIFESFLLKKRKFVHILSPLLIALLASSILLNLTVPMEAYLIHFKLPVYILLVSFVFPHFSYNAIWKFRNFIYILILFYLINYNGQHRPYLIYENNFELFPLVVLAGIGILRRLKNWRGVLISLGVLVLISGSLSIISIYFLLVLVVLRSRLSKVILIMSFSAVFVFFLNNRGVSNLQSIDRFVFWSIGLEELRDKEFIHQIIDSRVLPLDDRFTHMVEFYNLGINGIQYPVVLHALVIRLLLVFGIGGTLIIFFLLKKLLIKYPKNELKFLMYSFVLSGLSVSSISSSFGFLTLFILRSLYVNSAEIRNI